MTAIAAAIAATPAGSALAITAMITLATAVASGQLTTGIPGRRRRP